MLTVPGEFDEEIDKYRRWAESAEAQAVENRRIADTYLEKARKQESAAYRYRKLASIISERDNG